LEFDPTDYARNQLAPMLRLLADHAQDSDPAIADFFTRVAEGMDHARESVDLAGPLMDLSTAAFRGFDYPASVALALDDVLAMAARLSEALSLDPDARH
jgi:hypothetical protein